MRNSPPCGDTEAAVHTYGNMLWRISLSMLGCRADAEDAVQETFLRYALKAPGFESAEHEKAWLIRVCLNQCRDIQRSCRRQRKAAMPGAPHETPPPCENPATEALSRLPEKFRLVLALHYVEGYSVNEIAPIIRRTPSAVKMRLKKGRKMLEDVYRREYL